MLTMPVSMAKAGESVTIIRITGNDKVRAHLHELGFVENDKITVISKVGENVIVKVKESRVALDMSMARRILVQ